MIATITKLIMTFFLYAWGVAFSIVIIGIVLQLLGDLIFGPEVYSITENDNNVIEDEDFL